jgi:hypothetical protein
MSDLDIQARRDAAKADARAKRAADSVEELRARLEAPLLRVTQTVLSVIAAFKRKGLLDAADLTEEVAQLQQAHTTLAHQEKSPFDFS